MTRGRLLWRRSNCRLCLSSGARFGAGRQSLHQSSFFSPLNDSERGISGRILNRTLGFAWRPIDSTNCYIDYRPICSTTGRFPRRTDSHLGRYTRSIDPAACWSIGCRTGRDTTQKDWQRSCWYCRSQLLGALHFAKEMMPRRRRAITELIFNFYRWYEHPASKMVSEG